MDNLNVIRFSQFLEKQGVSPRKISNENIDEKIEKDDLELTEVLDNLIESEKSELSSDDTDFLDPSKDYKGKPDVDPSFDPIVDIEDYVIDEEDPDELDEEDSLPEFEFDIEDKEEGFGEEEVIKSEQIDEEFYPLFRDKTEDFTCDLSIQGAKIDDTEVRLVIESDNNWNVMFRGEVTTDGKCIVPLNKLSIYNDGDTGTIRLEVIAENTVFIPWERVYKIESSKKVNALVNESTTNKKKIGFVKTKVEAKISNRK